MTQHNLAEQSKAISLYLDSLLNDVDDEQITEDIESSETVALDAVEAELRGGVTDTSEPESIDLLSIDMDVLEEGEPKTDSTDTVEPSIEIDELQEETDSPTVDSLSIELDVMDETVAETADNFSQQTDIDHQAAPDSPSVEQLSIDLDVLDESTSEPLDNMSMQDRLDNNADDIVEDVEAIIEVKPPALQLAGQPEAIIPEWANTSFQAMLFKVGDLSLALPVTELLGVVEWKDIKPDNADQKIVLGSCQYQQRDVTVVDTARFVFPAERYTELAGESAAHRVTRIVVIQDNHWGLACDSIHEIITIEPEEVRWRTAKTQRQWLVGTSVKDMYAILNIEGLKSMLEAENPSG